MVGVIVCNENNMSLFSAQWCGLQAKKPLPPLAGRIRVGLMGKCDPPPRAMRHAWCAGANRRFSNASVSDTYTEAAKLARFQTDVLRVVLAFWG